MPSIALESVAVEYPGADRRVTAENRESRAYIRQFALSDINLEISAGERLGVIGPNGSGKSTLLRVIAGIYPPLKGTVNINGTISALLDFRLGLDPLASGDENIITMGLLHGISRRQIQETRTDIAQFCGLGVALAEPVRTYSSGMRVRLAFAIASAIKPSILVLDEWISVGDRQFADKMQNRMNGLIDNSEIVVFASHNLGLLQNICTRVVILSEGELYFDGDPTEAIQRYRSSDGS